MANKLTNYFVNSAFKIQKTNSDSPGYEWTTRDNFEKLSATISKWIVWHLESNKLMETFTMSSEIVTFRGKSISIPSYPILTSIGLEKSKKPLLIIFQGAGGSKFCQWSSIHCVRDSLLEGSMIPIIKEALYKGYSVIVMNPNLDEIEAANPGKEYLVLKRAGFIRNAVRVWDEIVSKCRTLEIFILAHSFGGIAVTELFKTRDDFKKRVKAIAFTDSVHDVFEEFEDAKQMRQSIIWLKDKAINFVVSPYKIGTPLENRKSSGCPCVSAGTEDHSYTTQSSQHQIFKFFASKRQKNQKKNIVIFIIFTILMIILFSSSKEIIQGK